MHVTADRRGIQHVVLVQEIKKGSPEAGSKDPDGFLSRHHRAFLHPWILPGWEVGAMKGSSCQWKGRDGTAIQPLCQRGGEHGGYATGSGG